MSGLTRRQFLQAAGLVGVAAAVPPAFLADVVLGGGLADPSGAGTTLAQTIRLLSSSGYSKLGYGAGEPFVLREDLGATAATERSTARRALAYLGHHSDTHMLDTQSPARLEPADILYRLGAGSAYRPNEPMTVHVVDQMIRATNAMAHSSVTGAPMAFCAITGDLTDSNTAAEHRWLVDTYDGKEVTPNTGGPAYEGVQAWSDAPWAYHPDGAPGSDIYRRAGYPAYGGMLEAAIGAVDTTGIAVPWLAVFGNHDFTWDGTLPKSLLTDVLASGNKKAATLGPLVQLALLANVRISPDLVRKNWNGTYRPGNHDITPDPVARRMLSPLEFMQGMFTTDSAPGPIGHGFDDTNLSTGRTYWARTEGPCRLIGMDSCNHFTGAEGSMSSVQFAWLESELIASSTRYYDTNGNVVHNPAGTDRLILAFSHHNSWTMTNSNWDPTEPFSRRYGHEVVALFKRFPNVVAWLNGHSHENHVLAHRNPHEAGAGFWEVNTASCIDYGQHQRVIEVVDNRDGTVSLFSTVVDHAAPADPGAGSYTPQRLASISRELAANDPFGDTGILGTIKPTAKLGKAEDRNCELVLKAPFDMAAAYTDAQAQLDQIAWEARILAR